MKKFKIVTAIVAIVVLILAMTSAAMAAFGMPSVFDTTWAFDRAIICLPDANARVNEYFYVEGKVQSWKDYPDSDVIQVKIDGVTYLTHYSNVVMIDE